ncbi:HesB/IscA family protein [Flexibacterium corallicola]|uniref:HesB/IscA family protein n=1 Tax=Flexibacterium corallicola TaxID=3037259 RepID=UPI00286F8509|nr:iron-sulfur cluster assembly accessory protein [Pseudovibrio sp. M1P-2-3]
MAGLADFKIISVDDEAAAQIQQIMASRSEKVEGLRIGIKKGGCAGMEYTMDLVEQAQPGDDIVEDNGVKVFIEPSAALYLLGTKMGFESTKFRSGFTFKNPNEISACGCGESVEISPAELPNS